MSAMNVVVLELGDWGMAMFLFQELERQVYSIRLTHPE